MVPAYSVKVSRVLTYSGSCCADSSFTYGAFTLFGWSSQCHSVKLVRSRVQSEPQHARTLVWALPISLAATLRIDVSFFSSPYLDVSVQEVPLRTLWIHVRIHGVFPCGFPHSDIPGSSRMCRSPGLFAACHVFHRLKVPRHPPCALCFLTRSLVLFKLFSDLSVCGWVSTSVLIPHPFGYFIDVFTSVFGFQGTSDEENRNKSGEEYLHSDTYLFWFLCRHSVPALHRSGSAARWFSSFRQLFCRFQ